MRRYLALVIALAAATIGLGVSAAASAQRLPPHRFFGKITLNNTVPPVGTTVEAFIGTVRCGSGQTTSGGAYVVDVDHSSSTPGCGSAGATITFKVSGLTATTTAKFRDGGFEQLDISATGTAGGFTIAALNLSLDFRPCIPESGQRTCDATRNSLWNGEEAAWTARGVTDPDARFNETVVFRIRAGDPAVISIIARFLAGPYLQVTRVKFIGVEAGQRDEYVEISNLGGGDQDMTGWSVRSPSRNQRVNFPSGYVMKPNQTCRIYTSGTQADSCGAATFNGSDVWPDDAGQAVLYYDALDLLGADTRYGADPTNQPPPPNLQGVN